MLIFSVNINKTSTPHNVEVFMSFEREKINVVDSRVENNSWMTSEEHCMALNIYHEARGSTYDDMIGVASVTLNRKDSWRWPDSVCEVVYQSWAFSWTMDDLSDIPYEKKAWNTSIKIAKALAREEIPRNTKANHYYNPAHASPKWSIGVSYTIIGSHKYLTI